MRKQILKFFLGFSIGMALLLSMPLVRAQEAPAALSLGGEVILRVRQTTEGMTPQQRVDAITERLLRVIEIPDITPDDVIVYQPSGKAPIVFATGRRLLEVNAAMVTAVGNDPAARSVADNLAVRWAKQLQQILPRVDYRKPNEPEPVVPAHPALLVTTDLSKVRGESGEVWLRDTLIGYLDGPQPEELTAAERADILSSRLNQKASQLDKSQPNLVTVAKLPNGSAQVSLAGSPILTADTGAALMAGSGSALRLAQTWAKNLRNALDLPGAKSSDMLLRPKQ